MILSERSESQDLRLLLNEAVADKGSAGCPILFASFAEKMEDHKTQSVTFFINRPRNALP